MNHTPTSEAAAEAAAERAAIQDEGMTEEERAVAFSWGRDSLDAYPKQRTEESFAEFAKYVCSHRAKEKGKFYFCAPFAEQDGKHHRCKDDAAPRRFLPLDLDYIPNGEALLDLLLALQPFRHFAYTTASHTAELPRLRVVLELARLVDRDEGLRIGLAFQAQLVERTGVAELEFDQTVYRAEQPCFGPLTHSEIYPRDRRMSGAVLDVDELLAAAPEIDPTVTAAERAERIAHDDPRIQYLYDAGFVLAAKTPPGKLAIRCPNAGAHSAETSPTATVVLLPHFNGVVHAKIKCLHESCANVTQDEFWRLAGYGEPGKRGNGADAHEDPGASAGEHADRDPDHGNAESERSPRPSYIIHESESTALLSCNYAIKGIVDLQSLVLIYGASHSGKTFFTLDMLLHVAHELRWRGRRVRQCLVLYIAAEAGISLQRRVRAWLDHHDNVDPARGAFWIRQRGISFMDPDAADQIEAELSTVDNPDHLPIVIVVDTLSRSLAGGDENRDLPTAIAVCDRLRDRMRATLVLVHHTGKDADKGPRGHSSLFAAVDTSLCVQDDGGNRAAIVDKARDAVHGTALAFSLRPVQLGTDDDGDITSTCIVEHQADQAGPVRTRSAGALPAGAALVLTAIQQATGAHGLLGSTLAAFGVPADVRAVMLADARAVHQKMYGERDDDAKRGDRARQTAFSRGLDQLQQAGLAAMANRYVWQPSTR
jgi:hypothetical protein